MTIAALTSKSPYVHQRLGGRVPTESCAELPTWTSCNSVLCGTRTCPPQAQDVRWRISVLRGAVAEVASPDSLPERTQYRGTSAGTGMLRASSLTSWSSMCGFSCV